MKCKFASGGVQDAAIKARAADRTGRFYAAAHSVKHNILTGEDLELPSTVPPRFRVLAPWERDPHA